MKKYLQLYCPAYLMVAFVVLLLCCGKSYAAIRYVKTGSVGIAPYTTWATASNDLQAVINQCVAGDEIWIATGTYKPNRRADALTVITATNRNNAFVLMSAVKVYGGFTGTETLLNQRNVTANVVTLSGDIGTVGVDTDNCYHVVISSGNTNATRLDGVQVVLGNANGSGFTSVIVNTRTVVTNRGGGIYAAASSAVFDECTIRRNNTVGNGAGVYDTLSAATDINGCTIVQNIAGNNGGAIYNTNSSPDITSCDIIQNEAGNNGGGIYNTNSSPDITSCSIEQNEAVNNGGGIYNNSSTPDLSTNNILNNQAGNNGGGIYNAASSNNITNGFIADNTAINNGGGIYNAASGGTITSIKILRNAAVRGGSIYNSSSSPLVSGCALYNNTASASGGAAYNLTADAVVFDNCAFNSNTAATSGGAIYFNAGTAPVVKNCSFRGNSAVISGGSLYVSNSDATFVNCLLSGNLAATGGGMFIGAANPVVINCTVVANRATSSSGGVGISSGSSIILRNSIVWSNTAPVGNNMGGGGTITASYSNIEGGATGTGNINAVSLFTAPEPAASAPTLAGDYRVQKCSPVINAGSNSLIPSGITEDIDDNDRVNYFIVDMGAYEKTLAIKAPSGIVYVDHTKNGNGRDWNNASPSLADALLTAKYDAAITQIWVAKGTYFPEYNATNLASLVCNPANRYNSFVLVNNLKVYGGFENGAATLAERDPENNITILSGDINGDNTGTGNTYHVVISADAVGTAALDGFTITGGNADYSGNSVTVNGITVTSFYGGGMGISRSSPAINNCILEGNYGDHGGAISVLSGSPVFNRCIIRNNTAGIYGGALDHWVIGPPSFAVFNNCLITGNKSNSVGGAFVNTAPSVITLNNCTVSGNMAVNQGGGLWSNGPASEVFRNSIIWGNKVGATANNIYTVSGTVNATYCNIEGGYAGTGNISTNPLFINPQPALAAPTALGNYHLQKCSPAINVGSNALVPAGVTKDLDSSSRISLLTVDMGAYEKHLAKPDANGIVYVDSSKTAVFGDGSSWAKAVTELADALKEAKTNTDVKEIWTAKGTYKPIYNAAGAFLNSICHTTDRDASFVLVPDVKLYGGFAGGETSTSQRNTLANPVGLSGDIGIANDTADNTYHVVIAAGNVGNCIVDGVIIERGNATNYVAASIVVNGISIGKQSGGGVYLKTSSPLFRNCIIRLNCSYQSGAGAYIYDNSNAIFNSCSLIGNCVTGNWNYGAGAYIGLLSNLSFYGCRITGNRVYSDDSWPGCGLSFFNSGGKIYNCTFALNHGNNNSSDVITSNPLDIRNSIVRFYQSNPPNISTITNSLLWTAHPGTGNIINLNPLFVATGGASPSILGDYRLQPCSPAINMGDNSLIPSSLTKDLDSLDRIKYSTVDMGAYEMQTIDLANTSWKGVNTNWNDKINWCGGYIPDDTTNVTVPLTSNNPLINIGFDNEVKNISFANNTSIGIASTGKLTINGTYTNNGCSITNNGTWIMAGNAANQTFPGALATVSAMNNLEVNNPSGLKFDKSFQLTGTLTPTAGNIIVDNATVTLNSDATATARVATVPSGVAFSYTGTGKFEAERYIPPHRAWRLLTAPLSTATNLTISDAWQEGVSNANRLSPLDPSPGFGTTITKSTTYSATDGYDQGSTNNPSIRFYNGINWGGVPLQTNGTTPGADNGLINDKQGYMLFVRGDRSIQVSGTGVTATVTTLRPKGQLKVGPQLINCSGWTVIGNPYASPINFHKIVLDNPGLSDVFYVWDANLAGSSNVGGWVSYGSYNPGTQTYTVAPLLSGSTFANNKGDISSGSAFMVNYTGTITINENSKSTLGDNVLYRPTRQLSMNLYIVNADSSESLNDGFIIKMDGLPLAANAEKNKNFTENLAVAVENKLYAIQNRRMPKSNDTVFISTGQMKQRNYVLEIRADELDMPVEVKAYLEDTYLHSYTPVSLEGNTRYSFSINADSASISSLRFRLLFKKAPRFESITAVAKEKDIQVQWQMEDVLVGGQYEVERSVNGVDFMMIGSKSSVWSQQSVMHNDWLDISPRTGTYYYRIKTTGMDGEVLYSEIARATVLNNNTGMYIYPNPVANRLINLRMNNMPAGNYSARLVSAIGQVLFSQQWTHNGGFVTKQFPANFIAGIYQLEVSNAGKKIILQIELIGR